MKKFISIILTLAMAASITACSGKDENTSNASSKNETVSQQSSTTDTESTDESQQTPDDTDESQPSSSEDEQSPVESVPISDDENAHDQWNTEDFSSLGITNIKEMSMGELSYFKGSEKAIKAKWTGITDFEVVEKYGEDLFNSIAAEHDIYKLGLGEEIGTWAFFYDQKITTFNEAHFTWDRVENFYANWFFELDDKLIIVLYYGNGEGVVLDVYSYQPFADEVKGNSEALDKWNSDDFSKFGINGIKELNLGQMTYYKCTDKGLTVKWSGVDDFDAATKYGESLFDATSANSRNYEISFDEDNWRRVYNYNNALASFSDASDYWTGIEFCYSDWCYVLDGSKMLVSYFGTTDYDGAKCLTLRILCDD